MTAPAYPRGTPRHTVAMDNDTWAALATLAQVETGRANASELLRRLAEDAIAQARKAGRLR